MCKYLRKKYLVFFNLIEIDDVVLDEGLAGELDESVEGFAHVVGRPLDEDLCGGDLLQTVSLVAEAATLNEESKKGLRLLDYNSRSSNISH